MHNRVNVRAMFVYRAVHRPFGGDFVRRRFERVAVQIYDDHHLRFHPAFADSGWRRDAAILADAHADVAIACDDVTAFITTARGVCDLFFDLLFVHSQLVRPHPAGSFHCDYCLQDAGAPLFPIAQQVSKIRAHPGRRLPGRIRLRQKIGKAFERDRKIHVFDFDAGFRG